MKKSEVGDLLTAIAATDNRTVGRLDIEMWFKILPESMTKDQAEDAVIRLRGETNDWLTPKHIIDRVKELGRERLQRAGTPPIPGDLTQSQEREWVRLWCYQIKAGDTIADATLSANLLMDLPTELPPASTAESREAQKAQLEAVLAASKRVPPGHPATNRTEQQQ